MLPLVLLTKMEPQTGNAAVATWHPTPPSFASVTANSSMNFHVRHPTPSYKIIKKTFNFPAHLKIHKKVLYDRNVFLHDSFASALTADMRFIGQTGEIPPEPGGASQSKIAN